MMKSRKLYPGYLIVIFFLCGGLLWSQDAPTSSQKPADAKQADQSTESSGPAADSGPIALPKKKEKPAEALPAAPTTPKPKTAENAPTFTMRVEVPEVTVDVGVLLEKTNQFVPGLKPGNFRVYEDGVEQKVIGFRRVEAPITALLLCEFAATNYNFIYDMRQAAAAFAEQLHPQDYVALMTFDMRTQIVTDFTQDKRQINQAIGALRIPGFSERNMYDAVYEGLDRLSRIEGHKYIILIASGRDTFSRITYDKLMKKVRSTSDVTIFTVSTGGMLRAITEGRPGMNNAMRDMDYLMGDNQMKSISAATGGVSFMPRFTTEMPEIFNSINQSIRAKYQLVYRPSNTKQDGSYRKLKVELVDGEGKPLKIVDEKQKQLKYILVARDGYKAKQEVE